MHTDTPQIASISRTLARADSAQSLFHPQMTGRGLPPLMAGFDDPGHES